MTGATYICGGDDFPGARGDECQNALHDHPVGADGKTPYVAIAARRRAAGWQRRLCTDCEEYGWIPPDGRNS